MPPDCLSCRAQRDHGVCAERPLQRIRAPRPQSLPHPVTHVLDNSHSSLARAGRQIRPWPDKSWCRLRVPGRFRHSAGPAAAAAQPRLPASARTSRPPPRSPSVGGALGVDPGAWIAEQKATRGSRSLGGGFTRRRPTRPRRPTHKEAVWPGGPGPAHRFAAWRRRAAR
eukprot:365565-Chlamydomonas_euryale.AAC.9